MPGTKQREPRWARGEDAEEGLGRDKVEEKAVSSPPSS